MTSQQKWYYQLMTEEFGPVPLQQLQLMIDDRVLSATDQVRSENSDRWITVSELLQSTTDPQEMASDLPDSDDAGSDGLAEELDINDFQLQGDSDAPPVTKPGSTTDIPELDINAFHLQGDSDSPLPPQPVRSADSPTHDQAVGGEHAACWVVKSLGQTFGPMPFSDVVEMARNGLLSRGDEIQETREGSWQPVESLAELASVLPDLPAPQTTPAAQKRATASDPSAPEKKQTRPRNPATAAGTPPAPVKKRRKKKEDPLLKEIFAEVFTEEGQVREEMLRSSTRPAASQDSQTVSATSAVSSAPPQTKDSEFTQTPPPPSPPVPPPAMSAAAFQQPAAPPAYVPPQRPAPRKSSSGGGFQMPEPKTLGIIGGGLALVAILVLGFLGILPIPGFGVDPESFLKDFAAQYEKVKTGSASEWAALREDYGPTARELARSLATSVGSDPAAKRYQQAALLVVRLVAVAHEDKDKQAEIYADFNKAMTGGG